MVRTKGTDEMLWAFLSEDIVLAEAEVRLPAPPIAPIFARPTVRPAKRAAS